MGEDLQCHTGLGLGIGDVFASGQRPNKSPVQLNLLFPSWVKEEDDQEGGQMITVKEEEEEEKHARAPRSLPRDHEEEGGTRKKLRLSKEQSTILEESFRVHNSLNHNQKQQLAGRLSLRPRQVEVWFQNRRARTKLKQTEVDFEFLKKCCENLSDENRRLKRELQELRSAAKAAAGSSVYVQLPKATTLRMCPSCESVSLDDNTKSSSGGVLRINAAPSPEQSQLLRLCN